LVVRIAGVVEFESVVLDTIAYEGRYPLVSENPPVKLKSPPLKARFEFANAPVPPVTVRTAPAVAVDP
jgi:hypothetical protein